MSAPSTSRKTFWTRRNKLLAAAALVVIAYFPVRSLFGGSASAHLTATAKRGTFDIVVVETGELQAEHSRSVTSPVMTSGGRSQLAVQYIAPEGTTVDSGAVVVTFDQADQLKNISDKENDLKLAQADMDKLRAQQKSDKSDAEIAYENAKLSFELAKLANDAMKFESDAKQRESQLELKKAELAFKQADENLKGKTAVRKSELASLDLRIAQITNALSRATLDLERLTVHAPASGLIVYNRNWNTGKKIGKGDQLWGGQPVMQLPDLSHMQAVLEVNEVDVSKVKNDQAVEVTLDAFPDKKFTGKIKSVASIGNAKESNPSVKVFEVLVDLDAADSVLRPGMTVAARIMVSKVDNVISVPIESVFDDAGKPVVYVENGSSFERRPVTLGTKNDNFVIVAKGLKEGEKVSLTDPNKATEKEDKPGKSDGKPKV